MTDTDITKSAEDHEVAPLYVYGIVTGDAQLPPELRGVDDGTVEMVPHGSIAAVVTGLDPGEEIGTPDNLLAHSTVLDAIAARSAVLPMAFGTVVPSEDDLIETVLASEEEDHLAALEGLESTVQFTIRARYLRDEVLADLVEQDAEVARLRDVIAGTTEDETRQARIQLGEIIVHSFDRIRPEHAARILEAIDATVEELYERETGQVEDVVELAVLVRRDRQRDFEDALELVASQLHSRIEFQLLGPQAPYDFVGE